jgi:hypothetical protein
MTTLLTPGLYRQPALPVRATGPLARGDVALFLGYAVRGPVGVPVRVESPALFETLFGPRPPQGFLWPAVKGFFETAGAAAYVLRLTDASATPATATVGLWAAQASFPWPMIDPRRLRATTQAAAASWVQIIEAQIRERGARSPDPGIWGNGLTLEIRRSPRALTETIIPDAGNDPLVLGLASLSGIEAASVLELSQVGAGGTPVTVYLQAVEVDAARRLIRLPRRPATLGLDARRIIRVGSVEFRLDIRLDGRLEQSFDGLAPDPRHSRGLAATLRRECRSLHLDPPKPKVSDWADPAVWPPEGSYALRGGSDGLTKINAATWLAALPAVARLSEPALIAAPDLVLPDLLPQADEGPLPEPRDCTDLSIPPEGRLAGRVTTGDFPDAPGSGTPVSGAAVDVTGPGGQTTTDADGRFAVIGIELGLVTLRITKPGFEPLEVLVQSSAFELPPQPFELQLRTQPRALTETEVLEIAQALAEPALVGPYKIAVVDPPSADTRLDDLRSWRSRLGDTARVGLFGPWLRIVGPTGAETALVSVPPCGHICGAFAAAEREAGIHRSGANRPLRFVEGLTLAIDDGEQGVLNPAGINAIRAFPGRGIRANGSRTLSSDPEWRFLTTRRIVDAIEKTLESSLAWVVFEPNNLLTRHTVTVTVATFLNQLWRDGVLAGVKPEAAYTVKCDSDNNTDADQAEGRLSVDIGVAPTEPYEFILFRLGHAQDALKVTE